MLLWSLVVYAAVLLVLKWVPRWFGVDSIYTQPFYINSSILLTLVIVLMGWMFATTQPFLQKS